MMRATKIVATLGPASTTAEVLERMIAAGVDVVRLNFSHGKAADHAERARLVRAAAAKCRREIAILADLQGPKIRIGRFKDGGVTLQPGQAFALDASREVGDSDGVGLDYKDLPRDVKSGDILWLNDGLIELAVDRVDGETIHTRVNVGGELSNNKGINKKGGGLSAPALTPKDMEDLRTAIQIGADYIAVSFPKNGTDMNMARQLVAIASQGRGSVPGMIAKIERIEAIPNLGEILEASDGIMVARGDLAVEVGLAAVPALQKRMIRQARLANKLTITATQMMESMITNAVPTRAEVSDVANAVLDGTDAVMLSAETATGRYPVEVVQQMAAIALEAERSYTGTLDADFLNQTFERVDQSIAYGALFTGVHLRVKAICALTDSGSTTLWMSRHDMDIPIVALTPREATRRKLSLYRNVRAELTDVGIDRDTALVRAQTLLVERGIAQHGDLVCITFGEPMGSPGGTNTLKIVCIGEPLRTPSLN